MIKTNCIRIVSIIIVLLFIFCCLSACSKIETESSNESPSMFIQIEETTAWRIVYHRETKVMYAVSWGSYNTGSFTVLVNPDGTPMLYTKNK